jgi:hypothetical protein
MRPSKHDEALVKSAPMGRAMPRASYFDPDRDETVHTDRIDVEDIAGLVNAVTSLSSGRGHPAIELMRDDGTALSIGTNGRRAFLVFMNSLGDTFHSLGGVAGGVLVYDYFGSWSEAPEDQLVPLADALDCAVQFLRHGVPDTASVIFGPD